MQNFISPLDIPLFLSGNYGELRPAHFHSGIDLKTQSVIGKPVHASFSGYISRINIQSGGYGNSLYITHPNGFTTVYAHLDRFIPAIQEYVIRNEYQNKSFEIELFPPKDMFRFKQGDLIGYSGNTGRSGGPHLHFEIRRTDGQIPLNGLLFNFPVTDNIPPVIKSLFVYGYPDSEPAANVGEIRTMINVDRKNDTVYYIKDPVEISKPYIGFGIETYDYLNGSSNRCAIYSVLLLIDKKPGFSFTLDGIAFDKSHYVDAHMDYDLKTNHNRSVHRLFMLPNNKLPIYNTFENSRLYHSDDDSLHSVDIFVTDAYQNQSHLTFLIKRIVAADNQIQWQDSVNYVRWNEGASYTSNKINIRIPPYALYEDILFYYKVIPGAPDALSDTISVFTPSEPLNKEISLEIPLNNKNLKYPDKILFASTDAKSVTAVGGGFIGQRFSVSTRSFGKYVVVCDTIPPEIKPFNFINGKKYNTGDPLLFSITDDLSGLTSYNAFIDDSWVLLKYDAKSGIASYEVDGKRLQSGKMHTLRITASDGKENSTEFAGQFVF